VRTINFAKRNFKEIVRDPLSFVFMLLLPLFLLFIFQQFNIPSDAYKIENFTAGIIVFSLAFVTMFTAILVSKDRNDSLLIRLGISPMKSYDYILGYIIALLPIIILQDIIFFIAAILLGLTFSISIIWAILITIPISILFIAVGILVGSMVSEKASSAISSIMVQLVCFTSGMYFDKEMLGKFFGTICGYLPFAPAVTIIKGIINNTLNIISVKDVVVISLYTILFLIISILVFNNKKINKR